MVFGVVDQREDQRVFVAGQPTGSREQLADAREDIDAAPQLDLLAARQVDMNGRERLLIAPALLDV